MYNLQLTPPELLQVVIWADKARKKAEAAEETNTSYYRQLLSICEKFEQALKTGKQEK